MLAVRRRRLRDAGAVVAPPDALVCVPGVSEMLGAVCGVGVRRVRGPRFGELGAHAWVG